MINFMLFIFYVNKKALWDITLHSWWLTTKKSQRKKCWWGCGKIGTLVHCWWECKMVQPLWKTVRSSVKPRSTMWSSNSTHRYPQKNGKQIQTDTYIPVFTVAMKMTKQLGAVAMPIIPALWEAEAGGSSEVRSSRPSRSTWRNLISTKNTKISQAWWLVPVTPAIWEAEAGEWLEPGRQRLQWAKITPLYSSLGDRARLRLNNNKKKKMAKYGWMEWLKPVIPSTFLGWGGQITWVQEFKTSLGNIVKPCNKTKNKTKQLARNGGTCL